MTRGLTTANIVKANLSKGKDAKLKGLMFATGTNDSLAAEMTSNPGW